MLTGMIFPTMWGPLVSYKSYIHWSYVHQLSDFLGPTACTLSYWKVASHRTKTRRFSKPGHPVPGPLKCIPWSYFALPSHHGFNIDLLFSLIICATTCRSYIDIYHMIVNCMMKFFCININYKHWIYIKRSLPTPHCSRMRQLQKSDDKSNDAVAAPRRQLRWPWQKEVSVEATQAPGRDIRVGWFFVGPMKPLVMTNIAIENLENHHFYKVTQP